jgi:glycosyltransferase involved in cell wall biosynthesis
LTEALTENRISVIIPCRNEEKYIGLCLDSVLHSDYPKDLLEILVVDGESSDNTWKIVEEYAKKHAIIQLLNNPYKTTPYALNIGIQNASGDYIIRLDAHSKFPENYFSRLIFWFQKLEADNVGGICITEVLNKNPKSLSIKKVLGSKVGVGNAYFRIGIDEVKEVDTVPFGCYKKETLLNLGLYNEKLTRNQDIELNKRLKAKGGKIYLVPEVSSTYFARDSFKGIARNNYMNGYWNLLTVYITRNLASLSIRHFIPLLFLLSLVLPAILSLFYLPFLIMSIAAFFSHFILLLGVSIKLNDKSTNVIYLMRAFYTLHLSYALGSLLGLLRIDKLIAKK